MRFVTPYFMISLRVIAYGEAVAHYNGILYSLSLVDLMSQLAVSVFGTF